MGSGGMAGGAVAGVAGGVAAGIDLDQLGLIQRILLTTDGTVTHILEAFAREQIYAEKLLHQFVCNEAERLSFGLDDCERALRRNVVLRGTLTGRTFLYAECVLMLDRLPASVSEGILATDAPIGRLLRNSRLETFREILACSEQPDAQVAAHFGINPSSPLLSRSYRIIARGRPVAWITEKFPRSSFTAVVSAVPAIELRSDDD